MKNANLDYPRVFEIDLDDFDHSLDSILDKILMLPGTDKKASVKELETEVA